MELISVIVPVYKVEKYLNKCIESIVNQSYMNIEIIIVDDGSPDNCPKICDEWAKKDSRIKVIHQKNGGLSSARNTGINIAKGQYLSFIDSDDYVDKKFIESLYKAIKQENAEMSICEFYEFNEKGILLENKKRNKLINTLYSGYQILHNMMFNYKLSYIVAWNKLYKKELFENVRYKTGKINEDEFIIHRLFYKCNKVVCIDENLYYYLKRNDSIMGKDFNVKNLDQFEALEDRINYFSNINMNDLLLKAKSRLLYSIALNYWFLIKAKTIDEKTKMIYKTKFNNFYKNYKKEILFSKEASFKEKITIISFIISPKIVKYLLKFKTLFDKIIYNN